MKKSIFHKLKNKILIFRSKYNKATPEQRFAYVQGNIRYYILLRFPKTGKLLFKESTLNEFLYRSTSKAAECIVNGVCISCGCKMPEKLVADEGCKDNCYKPIKTSLLWIPIRYFLKMNIP